MKATLVLNILSTIAAGIAIIMLSLDFLFDPMPYGCYYYHYNHICRYDYPIE
ncbi:membrane-spanning 4-domains subfamily A member 8-like, partial [Clarias magur]